MKKIITILITAAVMIAVITGALAAGAVTVTMQIDNSSMTVNGTRTNIDSSGTKPVIVGDRTLLPIRAFVEGIGGSVSWDGNTRTTALTFRGDEIRLTIDSDIAYLNSSPRRLDVAPVIINDRTMLPIRFIAESFGFKVVWEQSSKTITITDEGNRIDMGKTLIVYYPDSSATAKLAGYIRDETGGDMVKLGSLNVSPDNYDMVFIGYPVLNETLPSQVNSFLERYDLRGRTIVPFNTHSGSGDCDTYRLISKLEPDTLVLDGLSVNENDIDKSTTIQAVRTWLYEIGY